MGRRYVPYEIRLHVRLARRRFADLRSRPRFAHAKRDPRQFAHTWSTYERPLIDYPGQDDWSRGKRQNFALMAETANGLVLRPGEVFSAWRVAGRPTEQRGYLPGAALKNGEFVSDIGGGVCLFSTVVYNLALLGGLEILERHAHSQDSYGERRYFELARDSSIEYGYLDLRFRNPHDVPVVLSVTIEAHRVVGEVRSNAACPFAVEIAHSEPLVLPFETITVADSWMPPGETRIVRPGLPGLEVAATRTFHYQDDRVRIEAMPTTRHHSLPELVCRGTNTTGDYQS